MSFFGDLPQWFQMIIMSAGTLVTFFAVWKGYGLRTRFFSLIRRKKNKEKDNSKLKSPHLACQHVDHALLQIHKLWEISNRTKKLEMKEPLNSQMNYAEQKMDQVLNILQTKYLKLLEQKKGTNVDLISSYSYQSYRKVIYILSEELLKDVRHDFKENGFENMSEAEFNIYKSEKIDAMIHRTTELLNLYYFYKEDVTREELFTANMENISESKEIISEAYTKARLLAQETNLKLQELHDEQAEVLAMFMKK